MKWRWIAGIVCALYLSVGVIAGVAHDHSDDAQHGDQQCAACAWHHEAVDVPIVGPQACAPAGTVISSENGFLPFIDVSIGLHPSRGPPQFLQ
jgi:hypothetical protein